MIVILPARWEFGITVLDHVPAVHAIDGPKLVYVEEGNEALYPSATEHVPVARKTDGQRRNAYHRDAPFVGEIERDARLRFPNGCTILRPDAKWPKKRFIPTPHVPISVTCDVFVAPRKRDYGPEKNWPHWPWLVSEIQAMGLTVFAGGAPDSSYDVPCEKAWDQARHLDATIAAMRSARVVVATDAGLAHLAVLCGAPLLMITHLEGMVAPGNVRDERGQVLDDVYWPVKMHRYTEANHTGSPIHLIHHAWTERERVLSEVRAWMAKKAAA